MNLKKAETLSRELLEILKPHCQEVKIVGSIAQQKLYPRDIDIVYKTQNESAMLDALDKVTYQKSLFPNLIVWYKGEIVDLFADGQK